MWSVNLHMKGLDFHPLSSKRIMLMQILTHTEFTNGHDPDCRKHATARDFCFEMHVYGQDLAEHQSNQSRSGLPHRLLACRLQVQGYRPSF